MHLLLSNVDKVRQEEERVHRLALNQPGGDAIIYRDLFHTYKGPPSVQAVRGVSLGVKAGEVF